MDESVNKDNEPVRFGELLADFFKDLDMKIKSAKEEKKHPSNIADQFKQMLERKRAGQ